jgi:low temperature requirement protein LtrA
MAGLAISWPIVVAAVLGLALASGLWWVYFDVTSLLAERALAEEVEAERPRLARDAYSFIHLPLIAGIALLALGMKKVLEYVGDVEHHALADSLSGIGLYALYGGVALYLIAHAAFKLRTVGVLSPPRIAGAVVLFLLLPLAAQLPALFALGLVTGVVAALIAFETLRDAGERERIRHEDVTPAAV